MEKLLDKIWIIPLILCIILLTFDYVTDRRDAYEEVQSPGYSLVKNLYEFEDVSSLNEERDRKLKSLVTDNVYDELTFDNEGRMLRTYLKLKKGSVKVHVVRDTEGLVLYRLETQGVSQERLFALVYDVDDNNKISYVREMECIDFVTTID